MDSDLTRILETAAADGKFPSEDFLPLVYDELRSLASQHMKSEGDGHTLQATALVHEAWLKLSANGQRSWMNRTHFFRGAALEMRRILVDSARRKASLKRGSNVELIDIDQLEDMDLSLPQPNERILLIDEMLKRLEISNPEFARVVTMKFFGGLTEQEIAHVEGLTERTVRRWWAGARACLLDMMQEEMES